MIIAIDGYEANLTQRVGIGRYAFEIIKHIYQISRQSSVISRQSSVVSRQSSAISRQSSVISRQSSAISRQSSVVSHQSSENYGISFRIYVPKMPLSDMPKETSWWQYRQVLPHKFYTFFGLPIRLHLDLPQADVVFSPTHYIPRFIGIPRVMSVMDLSYIYYPKMFKAKDLYQLKNWTAYSAHHTERIITISNYSRNDIISTYGIAPERVAVTYPGLTIFENNMTKDQLIKKYQISPNYILSVGTLQPRKNFVRLIAAFAQFMAKNKQKFAGLTLIIIGKKGWLYEEILAAPAKFGVAKSVKFLDFVPDADLPAFYRHALCFALPSLFEGFGLPVAEAMAEGCPVVVSDISSLPEIAGKAGIYVKPENVDSITSGLLAAVGQRNLKQGKDRIKIGLNQIKQFSWDKAAAETLKILEEVGGSGKNGGQA